MLNKDYVQKTIKSSIHHYGSLQSLNQTNEELAELIVEVSKNIRGFNNRNNIIEEMADVLICFQYLKTILNITNEEIEDVMMIKLERLNSRIKSGV